MNIPTRYGSVEFARVKADLKHRVDSVINHMAKYHFNVKEMFYMYKPQSFGQILPPYNGKFFPCDSLRSANHSIGKHTCII